MMAAFTRGFTARSSVKIQALLVQVCQSKSDCMSAMPQQESTGRPQADRTRSKSRQLFFQSGKLALFAGAYLAAYGGSRFFAQQTGTRLWLPDSVLLCTLLL